VFAQRRPTLPDPPARAERGATRTSSPRGREAGFSLLEALVTLTILMTVMAVFYEMILGSVRTSMLSESRSDLAEFGQRAVNLIQTEILQSKLIFQEDTTGTGYRTLFVNSLPGGVSVWTNSRMPIFDPNTNIIGPDPGPNSIANRTGNSLIVVRQLAPLAVPWDHDNNAGTADINFLADLYTFEFYFLRSVTTKKFGTFGYYLDLVQARSETVADYFQINGVTVNKAQLITRIRANVPVTYAWDPGKAVSAPAFYRLNAAGTFTAMNPLNSFAVTAKSLLPALQGGRIGGSMDYSVALNLNTPLTLPDPVPAYATANSNFPGGVEFQVVGLAGSRKVMSRLVLASYYNNNYNSQAISVISSARGF
jgi:hypothetical protein